MKKKLYQHFVFINNLFLVCIGPLALTISENNIHLCWINFFLAPVYIFFISGKFRHSLLQGLGQIFNSLYFYKNSALETLRIQGNYAWIGGLVNHLIFAQILMATIILFHQNFQNTFMANFSRSESKLEIDRQHIFLLSFSHELRNLMNSVNGSIEICLLEDVCSKVKDILQGAKLCSKILLQSINNILDSGKIEINELEINNMPVRTKSLFNKIWMISCKGSFDFDPFLTDLSFKRKYQS